MSSPISRRGSTPPVTPNASRSPHAGGIPEPELIDENENDISMEELQEFMSADFFEVPADPTFKDRLREKLWELVRSNAFGSGRQHKK